MCSSNYHLSIQSINVRSLVLCIKYDLVFATTSTLGKRFPYAIVTNHNNPIRAKPHTIVS